MAKYNNYKLFYFIQALIKYFPFQMGIYLRRILYRPFFNKFGSGIIIHDNVHFKFPSDISINNNVKIAQSSIFVGRSGLEIGDNVLIGAGTKIITSSHNYHNINYLQIKVYHSTL